MPRRRVHCILTTFLSLQLSYTYCDKLARVYLPHLQELVVDLVARLLGLTYIHMYHTIHTYVNTYVRTYMHAYIHIKTYVNTLIKYRQIRVSYCM